MAGGFGFKNIILTPNGASVQVQSDGTARPVLVSTWGNTNYIYIADTETATTTGFPIGKDQIVDVSGYASHDYDVDSTKVWVYGTGADKCNVLVLVRE